VHRRLPPRVEGTLYFVTAEALTNVARYSQAPEVFVTVVDENHAVTLKVTDHGVGGADESSGSGLLGLADRVAVVDGTFVVDSPPGGGTTISCRVPVPAAPLPEPVVREPVKEPVS
jgi:signal transduction histidine kinase